ncbi:MAG: restriction endonuclease subunit S [Magnetococcales bacterium]|nr:restriction endonuclease subunit S [Magnetococcales bacterium]
MRLETIRIGDLGKIVTGKTPATKNPAFFDGDYPFVTPSDLDWKTYYARSTKRTVSAEAKKAHKGQFIPADVVMMTCIGNTIGKCGISHRPCLTNQQINSIVPHAGYDPKFIYYLLILNADVIRGVGLGGGAATPIVNKTAFSNIQIQVPKKSSWQAIASILSAYDDLIENNRRRIRLLEEAARLLYREWFVHFRFPGHEHVKIVDGVPEGWERKTAFDTMEVLSGGTPKTGNPEYWDGEIPFFTPKDATDTIFSGVTEKTLSEAGLKNCNSRLYPKHTVFITARGTVGKLNMAQLPMAMNQSCYALVALPPLNQEILYFALGAAITEFKGRAVGAVFDAIIVDTFKLIPFMVPPEQLVREFTQSVEPMVAQADTLLTQNHKLRAARDLLLPRLMNGEIVV